MDAANISINKKSANYPKIIFLLLIVLLITASASAAYYILRSVKTARIIHLSMEHRDGTVAINFIFNNICDVAPKSPLETSYTEDSLFFIESNFSPERNYGFACFLEKTTHKIPVLVEKKWLTSPGRKKIFIRHQEQLNEYDLNYENSKAILIPVKTKNVISVKSENNLSYN